MPTSAARRHVRRVARPRRKTPAIRLRDFRSHLLRHAAEIAPADVTALLARAAEMRRRAADDGRTRPTLRHDVELALALLRDHAAGSIPHVPYRTIGLLAAALYYYLDPVDVIPDFVPGVGTADDALVLAYAYEEGADGVHRYRAWRELERGQPATSSPSRPRRARRVGRSRPR
jgi:uncharacterized membrane protein YkvA (DUF1232 family)